MLLSSHSWPRAILHIDADAFFASCEQALHPEYRGKPVITGKERGIVAAASYEAKRLGISRGVPLWHVKKICPEAIILPSDYETYSLFSKRMFAIMLRFTPMVEEYSIDEAFCDITGFQRPYHASYEKIARDIKDEIEAQLGLTVSVGLSVSKVLAKIGSKHKKPSGFTAIPGYAIEEFLHDLPVGKVWGIGPKTASLCAALGMQTTLQFARKREEYIRRHFTKPHYEIWLELNGTSVYPVLTEDKSDYQTISKTKTFTPPSADPEYVYAQLVKNLENACIKARRHKLSARRLIIFLKTQEFKTAGMEVSLNQPSSFPADMLPLMREIFKKLFLRTGDASPYYRATGVVLCDLIADDSLQLSLFEPALRIEKLKRLYDAVDSLAAKMGKHAIHSGAATLAHTKRTHLYQRGDIPLRKLTRLRGETIRKHISVPVLQ